MKITDHLDKMEEFSKLRGHMEVDATELDEATVMRQQKNIAALIAFSSLGILGIPAIVVSCFMHGFYFRDWLAANVGEPEDVQELKRIFKLGE